MVKLFATIDELGNCAAGSVGMENGRRVLRGVTSQTFLPGDTFVFTCDAFPESANDLLEIMARQEDETGDYRLNELQLCLLKFIGM